MDEIGPLVCGRLWKGRDLEVPAPRVHDLLRIRPGSTRFAVEPDGWALTALEAAPWVVTRRAAPIIGWIPVGVRGESRDQRQAARLATDDILEALQPEDLSGRRPPRPHAVFDALAALAPALDATRCPWGPIGAAGFELASGYPALNASSDLDIAIRVDRCVALDDLRSLQREMRAISVRIDVLIETPHGGVAVEEALSDTEQALIRSASGPRLLSRRDLNRALSGAAP